MKTKIFGILYALLLLLTPVFSVSAAGDMPRLVDGSDLLSDREENALLDKLDGISEKHQLDLVIVTVNSLEGLSAMEYADNFYDYNGYGFGSGRDGILLLISMQEREWYMSTSGYGITAFTDAGLDYISDQFLEHLSGGDYMEAFSTFTELCDKFITQARTGKPYDVGNLPKEPFQVVLSLLISISVGLIIALIATGIMRSSLKSVRPQSAANNYVRNGGLQLTRSNDLFLYRNIVRRERPRDTGSSSHSGGSRTHTSSSGRSHGGRGGRF